MRDIYTVIGFIWLIASLCHMTWGSGGAAVLAGTASLICFLAAGIFNVLERRRK